MEYLDIVDERNVSVGRASIQDVYHKKLRHRIVSVLIFNDLGHLAVQQRSATKSFCPSHWCQTASGHVQAGESPIDAALRELQEEVGISVPLTFLYQDLYTVPSNGLQKYIYTFVGRHNGPFTLNEKEVANVVYMDMTKLRSVLSTEPIHPEFSFIIKKHADTFKNTD